jgi:opacity protein-like surface antigen
MSKSSLALAAALALLAVTPALAQDDEDYLTYPYVLSYHPFRLQIEGGHTITEGSQDRYLDNGLNLGLGFTWQPISHLPLAFRIDGMYQKFEMQSPLLAQAAAYFGTRVDEGSSKMWGGDIDAELDFPLGAGARLYLLGGGGWYDQQNSYRQLTFTNGQVCGGQSCANGVSQTSSLVGRISTGMHFEKNAGVGVEFAIGDRASFFVDARYMRFSPSGAGRDFIPIRFGVRY